MGRDAGPVRAPLTDLKAGEMEELGVLIGRLGAQ
jgi:5-dehydro-4-deoxyglucarate dehydratase